MLECYCLTPGDMGHAKSENVLWIWTGCMCLCHLLQHNIISSHQHGFLSGKSTTTQLLECTLDWNIALNVHCPMDVVYLDYAKAFGSVVHNKLIAKLARYGVNVVFAMDI